MKSRGCKFLYALTLLGSLLLLSVFTLAADQVGQQSRVLLEKNWKIQSSCEVKASGEEISTPSFSTAGWHAAEVPTTVVAALVADKTYPDPFVGKKQCDLLD